MSTKKIKIGKKIGKNNDLIIDLIMDAIALERASILLCKTDDANNLSKNYHGFSNALRVIGIDKNIELSEDLMDIAKGMVSRSNEHPSYLSIKILGKWLSMLCKTRMYK